MESHVATRNKTYLYPYLWILVILSITIIFSMKIHEIETQRDLNIHEFIIIS